MSPVNSATTDAFDELADLFLTDDAPALSAGQTAKPHVEILLPGHLPVRAGLWLASYTDLLSRTHGPITLVRLDGDEPMLEVMGASPDAMPPRGTSFRDAVDTLTGCVSTWLIRGPYETTGEYGSLNPDQVTILTGADSAAMVAAYQAVKSITLCAAERHQAPPPMTLCVVGADVDPAERLFDRVHQTARTQLGIDVQFGPTLRRIDVAAASTWSAAFVGEVIPCTNEVIEWIRVASDKRRAASSSTAVGAPPPRPRDEPDGDEDLPGPRLRLVHDRQTRIGQPHADATTDAPDAPPPPMRKLQPKPSMTIEAKESMATRASRSCAELQRDAAARRDSLAGYVEGLHTIPPRCPGYEHIELAVDALGTLHLLGRDDQLRDLHVVEAWADRHRALLAMAVPEAGLNQQRSVIHTHLFTDRPRSVADLHPTPLHLHVLAPVEVAGQRGWYSAPLNR